MNTPNLNPLIPQGSLLEQKAKAKPHLRVAYIIVAIHLVFLGGLLIQGCKKEDPTARIGQQTNETALPPLGQANLYPSNAAAQPANPLPQDLSTTLPPANPATQNVALAPTPESPAAAHEYIVVRGDVLTTIGKKFGVSANAIARANPGVDPNRLKVGQKLVIPAPAPPSVATTLASNGSENLYVVKSGDTLSKIATNHGTTVNQIKALNGLKTDRITAGEKLKLPAAKSALAPATVTNLGTPLAPPQGGTGNL